MNQENISNFIRELRKQNNLTQLDLANSLNVTYQAVSKWERGICVPDIMTLKKMCEIYSVNLNEIISGKDEIKNKINTKKNNNTILYILISIILALIIFITILLLQKNNFIFKTISTDCTDFTLNGSIAYNNDKTSIYISNVSYCGENNIEYDNIECTLFETYNGINKSINECINSRNITLSEYLESMKIQVNDYEYTCKKLTNTNLYIEIKATVNDTTTLYKIPLKLDNTCN